MLEVEQRPRVGTRGRVVLLYAQSARWAGQFVAGTLGEAFAVEWLPRVRDGRAMRQGGSGCDWRQFAGVVW
jgi:hypothetical protein